MLVPGVPLAVGPACLCPPVGWSCAGSGGPARPLARWRAGAAGRRDSVSKPSGPGPGTHASRSEARSGSHSVRTARLPVAPRRPTDQFHVEKCLAQVVAPPPCSRRRPPARVLIRSRRRAPERAAERVPPRKCYRVPLDVIATRAAGPTVWQPSDQGLTSCPCVSARSPRCSERLVVFIGAAERCSAAATCLCLPM